jgi:prevent-host-death family protein
MPDIGVRELKARTSQIVRNVRKRRARYIVTYRGRPVAQLTPIEEVASTNALPAQPADEIWNELTLLGQRLAESWPAGIAGADVLSEMRR